MPEAHTTLAQARAATLQREQALAAAGLSLRPPPPEPTSCCGRGCHGCVWEGFYAALAFWHEDAEVLLARLCSAPGATSSPAAVV